MSVEYAQWVFDQEKYEYASKECFRLAVEKCTAEFIKWDGHGYFKNGEVVHEANHDGTMITTHLTAGDLKAWMHYYGSGMYMDKSNPDYHRYISSSDFSHNAEHRRARTLNNFKIVTRGSENYTRPNYEAGSGKITEGGADPVGRVVFDGFRPMANFNSEIEYYFIRCKRYHLEFMQEKFNVEDFFYISKEVM